LNHGQECFVKHLEILDEYLAISEDGGTKVPICMFSRWSWNLVQSKKRSRSRIM